MKQAAAIPAKQWYEPALYSSPPTDRAPSSGRCITKCHFHYTRQDGSVRRAISTLRIRTRKFPPTLYSDRKTRSSSTTTSRQKDGARSMRKTFWTSAPRTNPKGKNRMNRQEREEWEILCRRYRLLQEAIQGCRKNWDFIHCARAQTLHGGGRNAV